MTSVCTCKMLSGCIISGNAPICPSSKNASSILEKMKNKACEKPLNELLKSVKNQKRLKKFVW